MVATKIRLYGDRVMACCRDDKTGGVSGKGREGW